MKVFGCPMLCYLCLALRRNPDYCLWYSTACHGFCFWIWKIPQSCVLERFMACSGIYSPPAIRYCFIPDGNERFQTFHHCLFVSFILPSFVFMIVWITPKSHQKEICEWVTEFWKRWEEHTVCSFYSQSCLFVSLVLVLHCTLLAHTMMEFLEVLGEERVNERRRVCLTSVFQCVRPSSSVFAMTS